MKAIKITIIVLLAVLFSLPTIIQVLQPITTAQLYISILIVNTVYGYVMTNIIKIFNKWFDSKLK